MTLGYCTNIHPAETWPETLRALETHTLKVRDLLLESDHHPIGKPYPIGLRLSAQAAAELLHRENLQKFKDWLDTNNSYVFTINGFPYGSFHGSRVKEQVFLPDWTSPERISYTQQLFKIIAELAPKPCGGSISTLPGSHKTFQADESVIRENLIQMAYFIEDLSQEHQVDLHLGLEPEPLGHFENTSETLAFFDRLRTQAKLSPVIHNRIGLNFDTCHFAIEYDDAAASLEAIRDADIRLSKIHLSSAIALKPNDPSAIKAIGAFEEPTYFHQVIAKNKDSSLERFVDLPDFLKMGTGVNNFTEARVHFHIPLDTEPSPPLKSTISHVQETLAWCQKNPTACQHFEIETYTWGVLPENLQRPVEEQIAAEYRWVLNQLKSF